MFLKNEIRFCLFTLTVLFVSSRANGQNKADVEVYSANFKHVAFVTADTTYRFTHAIKQNGSFVFWQGFVDSTYKDDYVCYSVLDDVSLVYRYDYSFIPCVDTVRCYLPIEHVEYDKNSLINIGDEVKFSYILKKANEPIIMDSKQDVVRVLFPCEEFNQCNSYNLLKVVFNGDSATLYIVTLYSSDLNGMQVVRRDSCQLKRKDVESIRKLLSISGASTNTICRREGNPWLTETLYKGEYHHSIISYFCLRSAKGKWPASGVPFLLMQIGRKRFGLHDFRFCAQKTPRRANVL